MNSIRITVATLLVSALTYAGAAVPSYAADPDPAPTPVPALPDVAQAPAEVLETAQEVLSGEVEGEPTQALVELFHVLPELTGRQRTAAQRLLARPDGEGVIYDDEPDYGLNNIYAACGAHICVQYVKTGIHKVNLTDADVDTIPDWVETNLAAMEKAWAVEVTNLGYRTPRRDGDWGEDLAHRTVVSGSVDNKIDVYLAQLPEGLFGYAQPESEENFPDTTDNNPRTTSAHMVLDADFTGFTCAPLVCLQATAGHEFFHVIQFAYDVAEPGWVMESTATWMEERVFDSANDNRNYLPFSSLRRPYQSLDAENGLAEYGNWIFWEYMSVKKGLGFVRDLWARAAVSGYDGINTLVRTLTSHSWTLGAAFGEFSALSNAPESFYEEGGVYPKAETSGSWTLTRTSRTPGWRSTNLAHLASRNYVFVPATGLTETNWRLLVEVNGPSSTATTAYALVHFRDGRVVRVPIALNSSGNGSRQMDFSRSRVAKVTVNFGNASMADGRITSFRATAKLT